MLYEPDVVIYVLERSCQGRHEAELVYQDPSPHLLLLLSTGFFSPLGCLQTFSLAISSASHFSAVATASSIFSGCVPEPWRVGSLPPALPPMTSATVVDHFSAVMPLDARSYITSD